MEPNEQQIRFCNTADGVSIAYASMGDGPPLVKTANWLSHLEYDWNSPVWRHWITELSRDHTFIRYDERGCGLSERNVEDFSLEAWLRDLEAVVDAAALDRFPLLGISQGGPIAIAYASRHPEKVTHLILYGSYAAGSRHRNLSPRALEEAEMFLQLIKVGWGKEHAAFRQVFTSLFIPEATSEQGSWFNELQRVSTTPENAARLMNAFYDLDVREQAITLPVPTLVLHADGDLRIPFEEGRRVAALIPNSRFVPLNSRNHILLKTEPAWKKFLFEVRSFLGVASQEPTKKEKARGRRAEKSAASLEKVWTDSTAPVDPRWKQISVLFDQAVGLGTAERQELLSGIDDSDLRRQLQTLLEKDGSTSVATEFDQLVKGSLLSWNEAIDDLPGRTISHYRILEKIGEGGMGTIYKAQDERLERLVALKFLPPYLSGKPELKTRFIQEAKAAAALDHPNVCAVYEIDEAPGGQLFISMPCYEGETIKQKIDRGPLGVLEALDYAAQTAQGLAHAHAGGIVHRDIKPANLFITKSGKVKILDFGVAKVADANLTRAGILVGTIAYMSPEQTSGEALDYRTDLWSLGIVLYEMLAGRHPFLGESGEISIYALNHEPPESILELRPELPLESNLIFERLLAKNPAHRYATVEELVTQLKSIQEIFRANTAQSANTAIALTKAAEQATPVDAFVSGAETNVFVGREQEMERLKGLLQKACAGSGQMLFISGEPGLGKTSLVDEFLQQTSLERPAIFSIVGYCVEQYGAGEAYLPFLNALSQLLTGPSKDFLAPILQNYAPAWSLQFTSSVFSETQMREQLRREAMGATQERMLREMGDSLNALTAQSPVLLLIEDLHWADPSTVSLISYLGRVVGRMRLLLIGTYRPEDLQKINRPLRDCLRELKAHDQCEEIALGMLDLEAIDSHLDRRFSPNDFPRELAKLIELKTGGHPLFIARLARYLGESGAVIKRDSHWTLSQQISQISLALPESVLDMIRRRIELLDESDRHLLQYASPQGEEFLSRVLAQLLADDQLQIEERLDALAKSSRLVLSCGEEELPDSSMTTRYRFSHALYQNVLYQDLVGERRRQLHRQTGQLLEQYYADKTSLIAAQLAMHFEFAREFSRAVQYLTQLAGNASRVHASAEAVEYYTKALKLASKLPAEIHGELSPTLYLKRGSMNLNCSRFAEAIADFNRASELARTTGRFETEHAAANGLIITFFISHRLEDVTRCAEKALRLSQRSQNSSLRLETLNYMAQRHTCYGELDNAIELSEQIVAEANALKDKPALAWALSHRGQLHLHQTEYAKAVELLEQGAAEALETADNFKYMYGLFMLGLAQANLGRISAALATLMKLRSIAERNCDRAWLVRCPNSIGWIYREMQDVDRAVAEDRHGAAITDGSEFQEVLAHSLINLSYDYEAGGAPDESLVALEKAAAARDRDVWMQWRHNIRLQAAFAEYWAGRNEAKAEQYAQELLRVATLYRCRKYMVTAHKILAEIAVGRRLTDEAERQFAKATSLLRQYPAPLVAWKTHAALALFRLERGDEILAQQSFDESAAIIQSLAANVDDEQLKQNFLTSPAVRQVLAHATPD